MPDVLALAAMQADAGGRLRAVAGARAASAAKQRRSGGA